MQSAQRHGLGKVLILVLALGGLASIIAGWALPAIGPFGDEEAYFLVGFPTEETTFVLLLTNPTTITQARDILAGGLADQYIFGGTIVKSPMPWNPPWSYHVDPSSVTFARAFIELCDAHPQYVEEHLVEVGGSFLPGSYWCPWTSRLLRELPGPEPTLTPAVPSPSATPTPTATLTPTPSATFEPDPRRLYLPMVIP